MFAARQPYVNGMWNSGEAESDEVRSSAMYEVVEATLRAQVCSVVSAALRTIDERPWPSLPRAEGIAALRYFAVLLAARRDLLIETIIGQAGGPRLVTE